ncbi:anthranilate phosphoribosyltransferase [bacterium]|nr:anthranilate phosphoribosyltransferase [bacterium]
MIKEAIAKAVDGSNLSKEEAAQTMEEIMSGNATDAQIASFITALRIKGETVDEITGFTEVMRNKATRINAKGPVIDTCGTGGDRAQTFNISTISALIAAGAGALVAKHGNRSVSSKCGSADCLHALGIDINASADKVESCLNDVGIGFLFAPLLHSSMKYAIGPRREIGIRTVFNILGPMTNPAGAKSQLLGVYSPGLTETMATVLKNLGSLNVMVVYGMDGLDEITITGPTRVSELKGNYISTYKIEPSDFGLPLASMDDLKGGESEDNARICINILKGDKGPKRDVCLLNAGAAIYLAGLAEDMKEGIEKAKSSIDSGAAMEKLEGLRRHLPGQ